MLNKKNNIYFFTSLFIILFTIFLCSLISLSFKYFIISIVIEFVLYFIHAFGRKNNYLYLITWFINNICNGFLISFILSKNLGIKLLIIIFLILSLFILLQSFVRKKQNVNIKYIILFDLLILFLLLGIWITNYTLFIAYFTLIYLLCVLLVVGDNDSNRKGVYKCLSMYSFGYYFIFYLLLFFC